MDQALVAVTLTTSDVTKIDYLLANHTDAVNIWVSTRDGKLFTAPGSSLGPAECLAMGT